CCTHIADTLGTKVSFAGDAVYNSSTQSYWSGRARENRPACVLQPTSADDVSSIVSTISRFNALDAHATAACQFAVRSGGHTPWQGAANIENGVTVDLTQLNNVKLSEDHSIASVGAGATWGAVYRTLDEHRLSVTGGRVSSVGVGGLTLGGGISFFSPRYGFVCDGIESYEVVTASGAIEIVSASQKPDLFRALKGGSNNFGVVTEFRLRTFPVDDFWGGLAYYDFSAADEHLVEFTKLAGSDDYDEYAAVILSYSWVTGQREIVVSSYTKTPALKETPSFLHSLANIQAPLVDTTRVAPLWSFTDELTEQRSPKEEDGVTGTGSRSMFVTLSYKNDLNFGRKFLEMLNATSESLLLAIPDIVCSASFQPIPRIITSKAETTGGNVLGYRPEDGNIVNVLSSVTWGSSIHDDRVETAFQKLYMEGKNLAKEMGVWQRSIYLNYADKWQDPIGGYGEDEVEFLRNVSKKYDPKGLFQKALPGGFKL
ncbi:uncharacterized protein MYCFIDRAFT_117579, partial [Pseudocercospora fijiensis CIRAD86]